MIRTLRKVWETDPRSDPNPLVYAVIVVIAVTALFLRGFIHT